MPRQVYVIGMQTGHGCELTGSRCAYSSYALAMAEVEKLHRDGLSWMKVFTLQVMDEVLYAKTS